MISHLKITFSCFGSFAPFLLLLNLQQKTKWQKHGMLQNAQFKSQFQLSELKVWYFLVFETLHPETHLNFTWNIEFQNNWSCVEGSGMYVKSKLVAPENCGSKFWLRRRRLLENLIFRPGSSCLALLRHHQLSEATFSQGKVLAFDSIIWHFVCAPFSKMYVYIDL